MTIEIHHLSEDDRDDGVSTALIITVVTKGLMLVAVLLGAWLYIRALQRQHRQATAPSPPAQDECTVASIESDDDDLLDEKDVEKGASIETSSESTASSVSCSSMDDKKDTPDTKQ